MKKTVILSLTLFLASFIPPLNAQVQLGVQGGINLTDVNMTQEDFKTAIRTRAILGGIISYNFSPVLSLQLEPAYVQKGASVNATVDISSILDGAIIDGEATFSANYIEIPVLLKASFPAGIVRPYLIAGATVAFLLGDAKFNLEKATLYGIDIISLLPSDLREQTFKIKNTDFIVNFGAGITIPLWLVDIFIEGRYDIGLTDISEGPYDLGLPDVSYETEFKTRGIQIKAGLLFSL